MAEPGGISLFFWFGLFGFEILTFRAIANRSSIITVVVVVSGGGGGGGVVEFWSQIVDRIDGTRDMVISDVG